MSRKLAAAAVAIGLAGVGSAAAAVEITGAGSTFVFPVLSKWAATYKGATGDQVNYQSIGSGGGIAQIKAATVDFGATDKPLEPKELAASGLAQFPVVIGGVVPVVNVAGLRPGQLRLSGPVLAAIYAGEIKTWNHPAIARLNPGLRLPGAQISVVHRSDGSGTSFNFTHYLSQVFAPWRTRVGEGTAVQWPVGVGGKGNEGVAAYVKQIPNSIGYVEYAYVLQNHMTYAVMQNSAGRFITPSAASFQAAAATADWSHAQDFYLVMTNAPGPNAYPITATTWVLMYKHPRNAQHSAAAIKFFRWSLEHGQAQAKSLDYVPLPPPLVKRIETYMAGNIK
ncbi:MAG TPA: phosphate ABC transporter substrate-binding protein PstS [Allosphingosinicella sp.]|nr:phosphate ABC transporter substrate-binding protein PstS [Allosphingosinicella sp.]